MILWWKCSISHWGSWHVVLFIFALLTLTLFVIPYTVVLTGASFFARYKVINYFKPVFDAYYGPYKDKWRFWFGIRLWVLVAMLMIYTFENSEKLILLLHLVIISLFILIQASIKPFKNALIGWLDLFFMLNFSAVVLVLLYSQSQRSHVITIVTDVLIGSALFALISIILYHVYLTCNWQRCCLQAPQVNRALPPAPEVNRTMQNVGTYQPLEGSNYGRVYNAGHENAIFRESLLGSQC